MKERMYIKAQKRGGALLFYRHRERVGVATAECKQRRILDAWKERRLWCEGWGRKAGDERRRWFLKNVSHLYDWECLMIRLWRSTNPLIALWVGVTIAISYQVVMTAQTPSNMLCVFRWVQLLSLSSPRGREALEVAEMPDAEFNPNSMLQCSWWSKVAGKRYRRWLTARWSVTLIYCFHKYLLNSRFYVRCGHSKYIFQLKGNER